MLDTNTVSDAIKGKPLSVRNHLRTTEKSLVALSAFTEAELLYGLARKPQAIELRATVEEFLQDAEILPWNSDAAAVYGEMRAAQERRGRRLSHEDLMIAAHALSLGLTLVTHDRAFSFVDDLKTEDWTLA
jgi:tRNA(fMet)-specific endonuclease VapC